MPRVKLIRHGLDDHGDDHWGFPIYRWGECPHPRGALTYDARYPMPFFMRCIACGEWGLPPWTSLPEPEADEYKAKIREIYQRQQDAIGHES